MFDKFKRKKSYKLLPRNERDAIRFYLNDYFQSNNLKIKGFLFIIMYEYKPFKGVIMTIFASNPGLIIGKYGKDISNIKNYIKSKFYVKEILIKEIEEYENYNHIWEVH